MSPRKTSSPSSCAVPRAIGKPDQDWLFSFCGGSRQCFHPAGGGVSIQPNTGRISSPRGRSPTDRALDPGGTKRGLLVPSCTRGSHWYRASCVPIFPTVACPQSWRRELPWRRAHLHPRRSGLSRFMAPATAEATAAPPQQRPLQQKGGVRSTRPRGPAAPRERARAQPIRCADPRTGPTTAHPEPHRPHPAPPPSRARPRVEAPAG